jgi:hypothetical protein
LSREEDTTTSTARKHGESEDDFGVYSDDREREIERED